MAKIVKNRIYHPSPLWLGKGKYTFAYPYRCTILCLVPAGTLPSSLVYVTVGMFALDTVKTDETVKQRNSYEYKIYYVMNKYV